VVALDALEIDGSPLLNGSPLPTRVDVAKKSGVISHTSVVGAR
jgi:hypothetical protein